MSFADWLASNLVVASALALAAAAVSRWGRRPALAHALWLLVLLKMLTPPVIVVRAPWRQTAGAMPPAAQLQAAAVPEAELPDGDDEAADAKAPGLDQVADPEAAALDELRKAARHLDGLDEAFQAARERAVGEEAAAEAGAADSAWRWSRLLSLIPAAWLAGSLLWFVTAAVRLVRFHQALGLAQAAPTELRGEAERLADAMSIRCPPLCVVPGLVAPLLWGFGGQARLVLPGALLARLSTQQRWTLLAHELAHYRRRDHWARWLELAAMGVYWWCPLVWWARREMHDAEEQCCDAWVVWLLPGAARDYAVALVETVDFLSGARPALPPCTSGMAPVRLLRRRVTMIMQGKTPRRLTLWGVVLVLAAAVALPLVPSWSQEGRGEEESQERPVGKKGELERLQDEIAEAQAQFELIRKRLATLKERSEVLKMAGERSVDPKKRPGVPAADGDVSRRLAEVERKLDMVLAELRELRGRTPKAAPPPPKVRSIPLGPGGGRPDAPGGDAGGGRGDRPGAPPHAEGRPGLPPAAPPRPLLPPIPPSAR